MFCPKCGNPDQQPETFCRQCGTFLPDFDNQKKREISPEEHLKANAVLNVMTAVASLTLAILLYVFFLGKDDTPLIIYVTAGFLFAMFAWQAQVFWRNMKLKKHFKKQKRLAEISGEDKTASRAFEAKPTNRQLPEADYDNIVPPSVVERTTRKLKNKK
jgi:hypothetical protein